MGVHAATGQGRVDAAMVVHDEAVARARGPGPSGHRGLARSERSRAQARSEAVGRVRAASSSPASGPTRSGSIWVSTSTPGPNSSRIAPSSLLASPCAAPSLMRPSTSRSRLTLRRPATSCTMTWWTGHPSLRGDEQDALQHGLVVELGRFRRDGDLGRGGSSAIASTSRASSSPRSRAAACAAPAPAPRRRPRRRPAAPARARPRRRRAPPAMARISSARPFGAASRSVLMVFCASRNPGKRDEQRDPDRHERIGLRVAEGRGAEGGEHQGRVDEVGREMQRVGLERLAAGLPGDPLEGIPAPGVDQDGADEHGGGGPARLDGRFARHEAAHALERDGAREQEQERRLDQRRERLDLAVPVLVLLVGRLVGGADGEPGDRRGGDVEEASARRRRSARATRSRSRPRPWRG